jgi:hypothetical protein
MIVHKLGKMLCGTGSSDSVFLIRHLLDDPSLIKLLSTFLDSHILGKTVSIIVSQSSSLVAFFIRDFDISPLDIAGDVLLAVFPNHENVLLVSRRCVDTWTSDKVGALFKSVRGVVFEILSSLAEIALLLHDILRDSSHNFIHNIVDPFLDNSFNFDFKLIFSVDFILVVLKVLIIDLELITIELFAVDCNWGSTIRFTAVTAVTAKCQWHTWHKIKLSLQ